METETNHYVKESPGQPLTTESEESFDLANESIAWLFEPEGQRWPLSQMSHYDMMRLRMISNCLKTPITQVIRLAIEEFATRNLREQNLEARLAERVSQIKKFNRLE